MAENYSFEWDYDVIRPNCATKRLIDDIKARLCAKLLPKIKLFDDFKIGVLKNTDVLGLFINGTGESPYIGLDIQEIKKCCKKHRLSIECGIETTILHELAHAIQEVCGMDYDCKEAEEFAQIYYEYGTTYNFWKND